MFYINSLFYPHIIHLLDKIKGMHEIELENDLKATKVALKDAQDQLETLTAEKLRFIDSIGKLVRSIMNYEFRKSFQYKLCKNGI